MRPVGESQPATSLYEVGKPKTGESSWRFRRYCGTPEQLHALRFPGGLEAGGGERVPEAGRSKETRPPLHRREVWELRATSEAVVLGSSQKHDILSCATGRAVVRRRSGGGVVLLRPGSVLWVDVILAAGDTLLSSDVGRSFEWLGRTWQKALAACGVVTDMHTGPSVQGEWGRLVCFAGLNQGELLAGGAKVLGISQRRSMRAARFQSALLCKWHPEETTALLRLGSAEAESLLLHLKARVASVPVDPGRALKEFLKALPE